MSFLVNSIRWAIRERLCLSFVWPRRRLQHLINAKAVLKAVHGVGKIEAGLSDFYVAEEVQGTFRGMMIALPTPEWAAFEQMAVEPLAQTLKAWAAKVDLKRFSSSPRGPKKTKKKPKFGPKHPHVSTARLLKQKKNKRSS